MESSVFGEKEFEELVTPVLVKRERRRRISQDCEGSSESSLISLGTTESHPDATMNQAIEALAREIAQARQEGSQTVPRFHPGVFVGMLNSSSEAVVVTEQGAAIKTRAANVMRLPESERWGADRILGMRAVPVVPTRQ